MSKSVLCVGFELADVHSESFRSKTSLLDWDIILFKPDIADFIQRAPTSYLGKPCLSDDESFKLRECCEHWRRQIRDAVNHGKTVIIFLPQEETVFAATGTVEVSGTGRNAQRTRHVDTYSSFVAVPFDFRPGNAVGKEMKLAPLGAEILAAYWSEFGQASEYQVLWDAALPSTAILTRVGNKAAGAINRSSSSSGALVMLPNVEFRASRFLGVRSGEYVWNKEGKAFCHKMLAAAVALDKALKSSSEVTPEPGWASAAQYVTSMERTLRGELARSEQAVIEAQKLKDDIAEKVRRAGSSRALLYEKGKLLESAIVEALEILGFKAAPFKQGMSEFDVVFEAAEGRLIGEAEGKDSKAINIDKLRQLSLNIHEDLQRDEVTLPAKGVLFGNGYRLSPPEERAAQFTEKCVASAQSTGTALIATTDLYKAVKHCAENGGAAAYAKACREAMLNGTGIVTMPELSSEDAEAVLETIELSAVGDDLRGG
ncbi:hypothetical protein ACQR0Z_15145 [Bradyrhizobium sp. HKCCYLS3077]|uniref:hypothetical protein n=1 Tax=Bradyrhizobium sp. HKCCYLS3077 TaxID=3420761 RepID=UPI003EC016FA